MKPNNVSMAADVCLLTPTTMKSLTQLLESQEDCLGQVPMTVSSTKTFVNLDSKCWQGGTTTVVSPCKTEPVELVQNNVSLEEGLKHVEPVEDLVFAARRSNRISRATSRSSDDQDYTEKKTLKRKKTSGRKPANSKCDEDLSPEEEERLRVRRLRNKEAAARCRKRRVDLTNSLMDEVDKYEAKKRALEEEVRLLRGQKEELEFILQTHAQANCVLRQSFTAVKSEPVFVEAVYNKPPRRPATLSIVPNTCNEVPIETPSSIIPCLAFDNLTTGLTPSGPIALSSLITPTLNTPTNCGLQLRALEEDEAMTSHDLVSL